LGVFRGIIRVQEPSSFLEKDMKQYQKWIHNLAKLILLKKAVINWPKKNIPLGQKKREIYERDKEEKITLPEGISKRRQEESVKFHREFVALFHTPCFMCGSKENLVFHHKDASTKINEVCNMRDMPAYLIIEEIAKCVSLCNTCHLKYHRILKARKSEEVVPNE
jgi:hypothetical protein